MDESQKSILKKYSEMNKAEDCDIHIIEHAGQDTGTLMIAVGVPGKYPNGESFKGIELCIGSETILLPDAFFECRGAYVYYLVLVVSKIGK